VTIERREFKLTKDKFSDPGVDKSSKEKIVRQNSLSEESRKHKPLIPSD